MKRVVRPRWWVHLIVFGFFSLGALFFIGGIAKLVVDGSGWLLAILGSVVLTCFGYEAARFPVAYTFSDDRIVVRRLLLRDDEYFCSGTVGVSLGARGRAKLRFANKTLFLALRTFRVDDRNWIIDYINKKLT